MYKSPIELIIEDAKEQYDERILQVVWETGVKVNKGELIKALRHERDQYQAGYDDGFEAGLREAEQRITNAIESLEIQLRARRNGNG